MYRCINWTRQTPTHVYCYYDEPSLSRHAHQRKPLPISQPPPPSPHSSPTSCKMNKNTAANKESNQSSAFALTQSEK